MFLAWFEANQRYPEARDIKYADFPQQFVYNENSLRWQPRKRGFAIGRIRSVPPGKGEDYYLRLLLNIQKGCTSFEDIRTVNNNIYPTFRDACYVLGLLDDDKEYIDAIKEASIWANGAYIRRLFVVLLISNSLTRPEHVWESCWSDLSDDIAYKHQQRHNNPDLTLSDDSLKNYALLDIEKIMQSNGKSLRNYDSMPLPIESMLNESGNRLVLDELEYDVFAMRDELAKYLSTITTEQNKVYDTIMSAVTNKSGGMYFLYGHGGTGKTFIWKTLSAAIRSRGEIVINVASSDIASLLLPGGRTAHSRFGLPIIVHEGSTCIISQQSPQAELLMKANLIIWDETPMMHRYCFEALDSTMRSILQSDEPFGGKVVVLGGDFRQILPVILKASRQDIVHATINSSPLWKNCKVLTLHNNMRLQSSVSSSTVEEIKEFADWILKIGNGEVGEENDGEVSIEIPHDMLIRDSDDPFSELLQFVYPDFLSNILLQITSKVGKFLDRLMKVWILLMIICRHSSLEKRRNI
ncbi:PREDICTED: uncharacterized protein LOC105976186 [Erythranthe guttata]|uniref:uncharacterized protein LOC105976186 n=1 Tax=Erythranthe guttata TaxID=4155 RepID=UPI00064DADAA|nr:PREDICTED: uncharacterized protein LOC105976186 [Erythranthe guttata]|eukprot:XP_012856929.1 PREDICTED: uncharacterized protein LOC105976186 [Erythranthe guttata]